MNSKVLVLLSAIVGVILIIVAGIYFLEPAKSLPHFLPGYDSMLTRHHYTHGISVLLLGLLAFVFAWFQSGNKSTK